MLAIVLIIQEKKEPEFNEWSKKSKNNSLMTNIITLFAIADVEALSFLNSQFAGLSTFTAKFSENTEKWLYFSGYINLILKDIPQLTIQVIILLFLLYFPEVVSKYCINTF